MNERLLTGDERPIHEAEGESDTQEGWAVGDFVRFEDNQAYRLEKMPGGDFCIRTILVCAICKKRGVEVIVAQGTAGWCYVYDIEGSFVTDLSERPYECARCDHQFPQIPMVIED